MKFMLLLTVLALLPVTALAQQPAAIGSAAITPPVAADSFFYPLERTTEWIQERITFDRQALIRLHHEFARRREAEIADLARRGRPQRPDLDQDRQRHLALSGEAL